MSNALAMTCFLSTYSPVSIPGIIATDAKQLAALTSIKAFDHVVQSKGHLAAAISPTGISISPDGVLALANHSARALYKVSDPEILFIGVFDELPLLCKSAAHIQTIMPAISRISFVILDTRGSDLYAQGIPLAEALPIIPFSVLRSLRTIASLSPSETFTVWVISGDKKGEPRATAR